MNKKEASTSSHQTSHKWDYSKQSTNKVKKILECVFIFILTPLIIFLLPIRIPSLLALYVLLTIIFYFYLRRNKKRFSWRSQFSNNKILSSKRFRRELKTILIRFLCLGLIMTIIAWLWIPLHFFNLPRKYPFFYPFLLILYPIFSVIPQGILFRDYFTTRYTDAFKPTWILWLMGTICFAWSHIVIGHWQSIAAAFVGGMIFNHTYLKSGSPFLANIEHSLYGNLAFTLGYGIWLYHPLIEK